MNYLLICLLQRCFGLLCSFAGLSVFVWVWDDSWFWLICLLALALFGWLGWQLLFALMCLVCV